ncbi:MAG TPA: hypothetical protein DEP69_02695 [Acidimicrobiaceae bacterium]|nr:hypothetical protein [Acidimicrobiaceae bacterium]
MLPAVRLALPVLAVALLAGACGFLSDDDDTAATTTTTASTATTTARLVTPAASDSTTTTAPEPQVSDSSKLSTAGLGPVSIGHALADAAAAAGVDLVPGPTSSDDCATYTFDGAAAGATVVAVNDEIVRIDIDSGPISTVSGYGIGATRAAIVAAFGVRIEDGPTDSGIQFVPLDEPDADKRVVWELDAAGTVTSLRTGRLPHVNSLRPCAAAAG